MYINLQSHDMETVAAPDRISSVLFRGLLRLLLLHARKRNSIYAGL